MKHAGGRPPDERRRDYRERFGLSGKQADRLSQVEMNQLDRCVDDMARRIVLQVTEKYPDGTARRTWRGGTRRLGVTREEYNSGD